jgi:hypothetical protein
MSFAGLLSVFAISLLVVGGTIAAMAVGVMFKRPCLRGSCGGPSVSGPRGERLSCAHCPNRRRNSDKAAAVASAED